MHSIKLREFRDCTKSIIASSSNSQVPTDRNQSCKFFADRRKHFTLSSCSHIRICVHVSGVSKQDGQRGLLVSSCRCRRELVPAISFTCLQAKSWNSFGVLWSASDTLRQSTSSNALVDRISRHVARSLLIESGRQRVVKATTLGPLDCTKSYNPRTARLYKSLIIG